MGRRVSVLGSVNVDLVVRGERLPRPGETVTGGTLARFPGGKGANQAIAAARMGADVAFFGCVGDDEHGRLARAALEEGGVDVSGLTVVDAPTGVALILVDARGENLISVAPGANALARPAGEHDLAVLQLETPFALPRAGTVVLNPAPACAVPLVGVDIVIANEHEARALTGAEEPAAARAGLLAQGPGEALVTLGSRGAFDGELHPAFEVEPIDTTGAGDAFVGAYVAALAEEHPAPLRFAQAAAALATTRLGAQSLPTRAEVERLAGV